MKFKTLLLIAASLPVFAITVMAATPVWDGGGADNNWSTDANWDTVAPVNGDGVNFSGTVKTTSFNDIANLALNGVFFSGTSNFTTGGNALSLTGHISNNSTGLVTINNDITTTTGLQLATNAGDITLTGAVGGAYIGKYAAHKLMLTGNVTLNRMDIGAYAHDTGIVELSGNWTRGSAGGVALFIGAQAQNGTGRLDITGGTQDFNTGTFYIGTIAGNETANGGTGTLNITGGTQNNIGLVYVGMADKATGTLNITAGAQDFRAAVNIGTGAGSTGTMNISGGTQNFNEQSINIGTGAGGVGTLNITGGTATGAKVALVGGSGGTGSISVSGGSLTFSGTDNYNYAPLIGDSGGTGTLSVSGTGVVTTENITLASRGAGNNGTIDVSGNGTLNLDGRILAGANDTTNTATINLRENGTIKFGSSTANELYIGAGTVTVNLDGGTLWARQISTGASTAGQSMINFNGTTIKATANNADFITSGNTALVLKSGGVTFDTNGFDISFSRSIKQADGETANVVKKGAGTLGLNAQYSGTTTVEEGTLKFMRNDTFGEATSASAGAVTVKSGAMLTNANTFTTIPTLVLENATLRTTGGASETYQAFKLNGTVTATGNSVIDSNTTSNGFNQIHLGGNAVGSQTTFNVVNASDTLTVSAVLRNGTTGSEIQTGLIKTGAGTLILNSENTYTGDTTIEAGTLSLGAGAVIASSNVVVTGGMLNGLGVIAGDIVVRNGGALSAGSLQGGAGALSLDGGDVTLEAGAKFVVQVSEGAAGTLLMDGGTLTLASGALVIKSDGSIDVGDTLTIIEGYFSLVNDFGSDVVVDDTGMEYQIDYDDDYGRITLTALGQIPEPSTYAFIGVGAALAFALVSRRRKIK